MEEHDKNREQETAKSNHQPQQNGLAIAAMVVGIISLTIGWLPFGGLILGIAAIVMGAIALKQKTNKGMSITGIVTGAISLIWNLFITAVFVTAMFALGGVATYGGALANELSDVSNNINKALNDYNSVQKALIDSQKDFSKGSTAKFANFEVKANSVTRNYTPDESYYYASEDMELIVVNVTVKNVGENPESFYSYNLDINVNGVSNSASYYTANPEFKGGNISKDASVTGNIVFEVEKGASNLKLQYESGAYDPDTSEYKNLIYTLEI